MLTSVTSPQALRHTMEFTGIALLLLATLILTVVVTIVTKVFKVVVWRPFVLTRSFKKQGITCPPYQFLYGSLNEIKRLKQSVSHVILDSTCTTNITNMVLPHYHKWLALYGETFFYWHGTEARVCITEPELVKDIMLNKFGFYTKSFVPPAVKLLAGNGLVFVEGTEWVKHRRIANPAFSIDKLKGMTDQMVECSKSKIEEWKKKCLMDGGSTEIEMHKELIELTADVIAQTAFGSSYVHGHQAFMAQRQLQQLCVDSITDIFIPGTQYLPTPSNIKIWKLDKKLKNSLNHIIKTRLDTKDVKSNAGYGGDLLGLLITSTKDAESNKSKLKMDDIVEECKTFFFAGHETTSNLLTWTMYLLSTHPKWQQKLRHEVLQECGNRSPHADTLPKLRLMNMVLLEVLRLYCPVIMVGREAATDMKLGKLTIPKGTRVTIPIIEIHRSKQYWGEDANEFNPLRFMDGVSKAAKHPNALLAFSVGPRACIGQNFAMMEAKTVLSLILQNYSFSLSPQYKHAPTDQLTLQPKYGMPIVFTSFLNS